MALSTLPRRPARPGEWTKGAAIIFIVTLAASGTVTLAAREVGMSRKSAYALKKRDPLFAAYWEAAIRAAARRSDRRAEGNAGARATAAISSTSGLAADDNPFWPGHLPAGLRWPRESYRVQVPSGLARQPALP